MESASRSYGKSPVGTTIDTGFVRCFIDSYYYVAEPRVVDMGYSDFEFQIDDTVFKTHKHQLVKFGYFAERIRRASSGDSGTDAESIKLDGDKRDVEDMVNTFKILYASVISGPFKFEPPALISAFRVAKTYDYPDLRIYCIERLEKYEENLSSMQRIELARAFDPNSREVATYHAMCKRDKPFTDAETRILGMLAWSMITRVRRLEQARQQQDVFDSHARGPPVTLGVLDCELSDEEETGSEIGQGDEYMNASNRRSELERLELEERKRGYEEALQRHQEWKKKEELQVKGRIEEPPRREHEYEWEGKEHGWEEIQEHEWKGKELEWDVAETSNPPMKGKNNAASRAFCALSSRYLAVAGRICGNPNPVTDNPKTEKGRTSDAKDGSTLFDEYVNDFKHDDGSDLDEKKRII